MFWHPERNALTLKNSSISISVQKPLNFYNMRKVVLFIALVAFASFISVAQEKAASPASKAEGTINGVKVTIDYHQPSAKGRKIMGGLVPYGEVWRTGANNTTSIEFSAPVKIEDQALAAGKYGLYTIPGENEWTIIINKTIKWGAYDYKQSEDVLRVKVKPSKTAAMVETFNIAVEADKVTLKWENTQVSFKVVKG
jgi:Protein of unknown function (DUF2911)